MSTNAPGLTRLRNFANGAIGPRFFLGIVGDANHTSGYHLGPDRIHGSDYSLQLPRDVAGARKFPRFACAYDMGMGWPQSRRWLAWLVDQCRKGKFPQVREIIGSLDGVHKQYWSGLRNFRTEVYTKDNHLSHTHISVFRDTAEIDHSPILQRFIAVPPFPGRLLRFVEGRPMLTGEDVRTWQARMRERGFEIAVDGVYGPKSRDVARRFQRQQGLLVDGIVGRQTWTAAWTAAVS